jgi:hypothetical protein
VRSWNAVDVAGLQGEKPPDNDCGSDASSPSSARLDRAAWSSQCSAVYPIAAVLRHTRDRDGTSPSRSPTRAALAGHRRCPLPCGARILPFEKNRGILQELGFESVDALLSSIEKRSPSTALAFSLDGRLLATGSTYRTVKLWDGQERSELQTLLGGNSGTWYVLIAVGGCFAVMTGPY